MSNFTNDPNLSVNDRVKCHICDSEVYLKNMPKHMLSKKHQRHLPGTEEKTPAPTVTENPGAIIVTSSKRVRLPGEDAKAEIINPEPERKDDEGSEGEEGEEPDDVELILDQFESLHDRLDDHEKAFAHIIQLLTDEPEEKGLEVIPEKPEEKQK
jgi:hypothetical protein